LAAGASAQDILRYDRRRLQRAGRLLPVAEQALGRDALARVVRPILLIAFDESPRASM